MSCFSAPPRTPPGVLPEDIYIAGYRHGFRQVQPLILDRQVALEAAQRCRAGVTTHD